VSSLREHASWERQRVAAGGLHPDPVLMAVEAPRSWLFPLPDAPRADQWAAFCAELPERIEAIRASEGTDGWPGDAPTVPQTAPEAPETPPQRAHGLRMAKTDAETPWRVYGTLRREAS
jgi:hypothetical protein